MVGLGGVLLEANRGVQVNTLEPHPTYRPELRILLLVDNR